MDYTANERTFIKHLINESSGNGHDFGLMELAVKSMIAETKLSEQAVGGLITSLNKKGCFDLLGEEVTTGDDTWNQYVLTQDVIDEFDTVESELIRAADYLIDGLEKVAAKVPVRDLDERYTWYRNAKSKAEDV